MHKTLGVEKLQIMRELTTVTALFLTHPVKYLSITEMLTRSISVPYEK
jgi:hypothetical protein